MKYCHRKKGFVMRRIFFLFCSFLLLFSCSASAHPGRTDAQGGHYDNSTGTYHFHHGYPAHQHTNGICPYDYDDATVHHENTYPSTTEQNETPYNANGYGVMRLYTSDELESGEFQEDKPANPQKQSSAPSVTKKEDTGIWDFIQEYPISFWVITFFVVLLYFVLRAIVRKQISKIPTRKSLKEQLSQQQQTFSALQKEYSALQKKATAAQNHALVLQNRLDQTKADLIAAQCKYQEAHWENVDLQQHILGIYHASQDQMDILVQEKQALTAQCRQLTEMVQQYQKKSAYDIENIEILQRSMLQTKFFFLVQLYGLQRILSAKKQDCRLQYEIFRQEAKDKIYLYEQDLHQKEYKHFKPYLSVAEFCELPTAKRNQIALDRYQAQKKSDFDIILAQKRYICYLYENQGYEVRYHTALHKLNDKNIHLLATKKQEMLVIQCKTKSVDADCIEQLSFSINRLQKKHPKNIIQGILYTTTFIDSDIKQLAENLHIQVIEHFYIQNYPMIKCNISDKNQKIYHLPFDQLYDKMFITPSKGDFYAKTVQEAEDFGFRHAQQWKPNT